MKNIIPSLVFASIMNIGSPIVAQETNTIKTDVQTILKIDDLIKTLSQLPYADIKEITREEAPNNALYFGAQISKTEMRFLGNGCIQGDNAFTAKHIAESSDWKPEIIYQNPETDVFIGKFNDFEDIGISNIHGDNLNGEEIGFIGIRDDKKWFQVKGKTQHVSLTEITMKNGYTGKEHVISGDFYVMRKQGGFNMHTLSGSCATYKGEIIGVLSGGVSIGSKEYFLISKITPEILGD